MNEFTVTGQGELDLGLGPAGCSRNSARPPRRGGGTGPPPGRAACTCSGVLELTPNASCLVLRGAAWCCVVMALGQLAAEHIPGPRAGIPPRGTSACHSGATAGRNTANGM